MKYLVWTLFLVLVLGATARGETIEVVYRWQDPLNVVDEVVYERLRSTMSRAQADYYYTMYARAKDDILISQVRYKVNQAWTPKKILLNGEKIKYEKYVKLMEWGPADKYHILYYQETPDPKVLLKLGEQPAGGRAFVSDVRFVPKVSTAVGKSTVTSLWHFVGLAIVGWGLVEHNQEDDPKVPPVPVLTITPARGTLSTEFYMDASGTYDPYEGPHHLHVRWDWENDGVWDTPFSVGKVAAHTYPATGTYTVVLQVIDRYFTSTATANVTVIADGPALMSSPSPMFHYCLTHTGLSPNQGPTTNTVKWSYSTSGQIQSSPAIDAANNIYVSSYDGLLYKILPTSATDWTYAVGGILYCSPALAADGTIYVGSGTGVLHAINSDSSPKWTYDTGKWIKSSPAIAPDGTVYVGSTNGNLYAINHDGTLKWVKSLGSWIESSPAVGSDGVIYVGADDGKLYAVNPNSTIKWSYPTGGVVRSSPAVAADGTVYFGSSDTYLYALYANGQLRWQYKTDGSVLSSPAIGADGKIYVGSEDDKVHAINPGGSAVAGWPYTTGDNIYSSPVIGANGTIYIGSDDGKLHAISPTGSANWTRDIGSQVRSTPVIDNVGITRRVYVGANNSQLYAIGADPIDPAFVQITKQANKQQVSVGDIITYQISVTNLGAPPVPGPTTDTYIYDRIPSGFKYVEGSTVLDGSLVSDPDGARSRNLRFDIGVVALNETKALSYQLVVGSGVTFGKYENKAYALYYYNKPPITEEISNIARETVLVVPDPLFDLGTIIGKVFADKNGDGIQDEGEAGMGGARIITEEGIIVTTDRHGKYHIPGVMPGTHMLKLQAAEVTTENPRVVRVTEGLLTKVNFGVKAGKERSASDKSFTLVLLGDGEIGYSRVDEGSNADVSMQGDNDPRFDEGWYNKGRLAGYLKGKISDEFLITSSLDTDRKGNRDFFRYISRDKYYPVYGDEAEIEFAATDTQGPLYLKVEHLATDSSLLWGNYHTGLNQTDLASYNRTLYGAQVRIIGDKGADNLLPVPGNMSLFAAQAHQVAAHNELRATGGSIYYLKNRDIIEGSEKVVLEVQDKVTAQTLVKSPQEAEVDYEIDYAHGRIIFTKPIASVESAEDIISTSLLDGQPVYVIVDYEYRPDRMHFNKGAYGGRINVSLVVEEAADKTAPPRPLVELGTSYVAEETADKNYRLKGVDTTINLPYETRIKAEYAESVSYGIANHFSTDGGLTFSSISPNADPEGSASGVKVSSVPDFLGEGFKIDTYYQRIKPNFISYGTISQQGSEKYGVRVEVELTDDLSLTAADDMQKLIDSGNLVSQSQIGADRTNTALLQGKYTFEPWELTTEYRYQSFNDALESYKNETDYERETAAVRIARDNFFGGILSAYLEQQTTLEGETNHQTTLGASTEVFKPLSAHLRGTSGTQGNAFLMGFQTKLSALVSIFSNYQQTHHVVDGDMATQAVGAMYTPAEDLRIYTQHESRTAERESSSGMVIGIDKQISPGWYWSGNLEKSQVDNLNQTETDRYSASSQVNYHSKELDFSSMLEVRYDEGGLADKDQYLTRNNLGYVLSDSFYIYARFNGSETLDQAQDEIEALFREYGIGLAYRPVEFDRVNFLVKYSYLVDDYPLGQESTSRTRANVYALEGAYDVSRYFQVVEKIATKVGKEKAPPRGWQRSQTDLWINRINYHLIDELDIGGEYRILKQHLADDKKQGFLCEAVYKASDYIHLGIGYNFTDFSDDLISSNDHSARGPFIRVLATIYR